MGKPWERREDETPKAFAAFVSYLELGAERSIAKASGNTTGKRRWFEAWSTRFDWVARARAFDEQEFAAKLADRERVREQARQLAVENAGEAMRVLLDLLTFDEPKKAHAAKVRLDAAAKLLSLSGVDFPKKLELSGAGGKAIAVNTQLDVRRMLADAIDALGLDPDFAMDLAAKLQAADSKDEEREEMRARLGLEQ